VPYNGVEPGGEYITKSATRGQYDAGIILSPSQPHSVTAIWSGTKLYYLVLVYLEYLRDRVQLGVKPQLLDCESVP